MGHCRLADANPIYLVSLYRPDHTLELGVNTPLDCVGFKVRKLPIECKSVIILCGIVIMLYASLYSFMVSTIEMSRPVL
jgi:hypothetical protein